MYSVVLMAALTSATEAPGFCWRSCGWGCYGYGCHAWYGCHSWCGCYGWGHGWCGSYGWGHGWCGHYGWHGCYACHGSYGCYGCYGCCGHSVVPAPVAPVTPPATPPAKPEPIPPPKKEGEGNAAARLIIDIPQGAKLYIDDQLMNGTATRRLFNTPVLERGQMYYYMVRVELERDGRTIRDEKPVIVRAGQVARADFAELGTKDAASAVATATR
ncbi:MAG: TIGR03000 domain-containing protein [Gemmataceae bacterium]|nr:TIGR03000 domain-containing protein [Gemmataceae bacterium]MDW8264052.1 TIGR03000 domain-containing protein [Gemmataceae bacterium]